MLTTTIVRDERGITLAEILVATVIISVGLVGLAIVIPLSSYGVHEGNALSTATFLAEQKLEEVRSATWQSAPTVKDCLGLGSSSEPTSTTCARSQPTTCTSGASCTTFSDETAVSGYPAYSRTVRVTDCGVGAGCAGVVNTNMRLVQVRVSYRAMSGVGGQGTGTKSAILEMIVAQRQ